MFTGTDTTAYIAGLSSLGTVFESAISAAGIIFPDMCTLIITANTSSFLWEATGRQDTGMFVTTGIRATFTTGTATIQSPGRLEGTQTTTTHTTIMEPTTVQTANTTKA